MLILVYFLDQIKIRGVKVNNISEYISKGEIHEHNKASEKYIEVEFYYPEHNKSLEIWIPIYYRRTGVFAESDEEINELLEEAYEHLNPSNKESWLNEQDKFWGSKNAHVTESFYESLKDSSWKCVSCDLPNNPNWARRVQDLKEYGYTIATNTNKFCDNCQSNTTHLLMLKIPRGGGELGYETISSKLKNRILKKLDYYDAFEATKKPSSSSLLPDHKFPEIRWDDKTKENNPDDMSEDAIKAKFQLLNNRRNLQKREVCRKCYQTNERGYPYGIKFYYKGSSKWPSSIPKRGDEAIEGCKGCGWFDLEKWRQKLNSFIENYI